MFHVPFQSFLSIECSYIVFKSIQIGLHAEDSYFTQRFLQGRHIQKLITLEVFVIEASCLQFLNGQ